MHGRSVPPAGRDLLQEFSSRLQRWSWDVALLQEVPPWWPTILAARFGAEQRTVLTSRNALIGLRRGLARRWPDTMRSGGGGANAIIARRDRIVSDRARRLCRVPERRWAHGAQLGCGVWVVNLHATAHDRSAAIRDGRLAAAAARSWAGDGPVVLGGDFNLREPQWPELTAVAGNDVDHIFIAGGVRPAGQPEVLERGRLSDHAPVAVTVALPTGEAEPSVVV